MAAPAPKSVIDRREKEIKEALLKDEVSKVVIVGEAGVGKTWMVREISGRLSSDFSATIWLFLARKDADTNKALYESIASQLSLLPAEEDRNEYDNDRKEKEGENKETLYLENLKKELSAKLTNKKCLWILDGAGEKMKEDVLKVLIKKLEDLQPSSPSEKKLSSSPSEKKPPSSPSQKKPPSSSPKKTLPSSKFLITETRSTEPTPSATDQIIDGTKMEIVFEPFSPDESWKLFLERIGNVKISSPCIEKLFKKLIEGKPCSPSAIVVLAETLRCLLERNPEDKDFESALEEIARKETNGVAELLRFAYDKLPNPIMSNCCWHSRQFFRSHSSVHCNELITFWILEGHLGPIDRIEEAYNEGHRFVMELRERGFLIKQEGNFVTMEGTLLNVDDDRPRGYVGTANLGLACVFEDGEWQGLGRVTKRDGMVKSPCAAKKWDKISTLLLDRHHLSRVVPDSFFPPLKELKVLALFDCRFISLSFLSNLTELLVFVLRGCHLIENIDPVRELESLTVLEISGASSLKEIPDNLFELMRNLKSLNLSGAPITSLPSSILSRSELRWLLLRGCGQLKELPNVKELKKLEVLDLCGAVSLETIKNKKLENEKLQMLDLSHTKIERLPFLHNFDNLSQLLLSGCSRLQRLPNLNTLTGLQVLDISKSDKLNEIHDEHLPNKSILLILNMSGSGIKRLPSNFGNLCHLNLKGCSKLEEFPCTPGLQDIQTIDLSDASSLHRIKDESFKHLMYLESLNLSNTQVQRLPSLSNLSWLRKLMLKGCSSLETLSAMDGLSALEELDLSGCLKLSVVPEMPPFEKLKLLDLSGCSVLENLGDNFFDRMSQLVKLNLSDTQIKVLPSLSASPNLSHLILRNCRKLETLPPLKSLPKLEKLDLYGAISLTEIQADFLVNLVQLQYVNFSDIPRVNLPPMSNLNNLIQLLLRGCSNIPAVTDLNELVKLEVLDLSGTEVKDLSFLTSLGNLHSLLLRDCSNVLTLPSVGSLDHLEELDLSGTRIGEFPYGIFESSRVKRICLPNLEGIQDQVDWGKIEYLPEELSWDNSVISSFAGYLSRNSKLSMTVMGTKFFQLLKEVPTSSKTNLNQFHISVCSRIKSDKEDAEHYNRLREEKFREIYSSRKANYPNENRCSLEIRGFDTFPSGMEDILRFAEYMSLIDNSFNTCISDLSAGEMKGCWVESCNATESILGAGDEHSETGRNLEELWVSNLTKLKSVFSVNLQSESFRKLKRLYLDCCPLLGNVFSASQAPENLEFLQIKFCDRLESVFEGNSELPRLKFLDLLELPQLKRIGGIFPSLRVSNIRECQQLKKEFWPKVLV